MNNIPVVKLGLIAVSRDCFPIQLSEKRRAAIKETYKGELYVIRLAASKRTSASQIRKVVL